MDIVDRRRSSMTKRNQPEVKWEELLGIEAIVTATSSNEHTACGGFQRSGGRREDEIGASGFRLDPYRP